MSWNDKQKEKLSERMEAFLPINRTHSGRVRKAFAGSETVGKKSFATQNITNECRFALRRLQT